MTKAGKPLALTLGALVLLTGAPARATSPTEARDYHTIAKRNVFGLKSPAPAPKEEEHVEPPPPLFLQGITTILNVKKALIRMQMKPRPGDPAKGDQSFILEEGQRDGELEIVQIDENAGRVKVSNHGVVMDIDFENNGLKPSAAPPSREQAPGIKAPAVAASIPPNRFAQMNGGIPRQLPQIPAFRTPPPMPAMPQ